MRKLVPAAFTAALLACIAAGAAPAQAGDPLRPFEARYRVRIGGVTAAWMDRTLSLVEERYDFESTTKTSGLVGLFRAETIRESSRWAVTADGVRSIQYGYERSGGRKDRSLTILFDAQRGIETIAGPRRTTMAFDPSAVDKLSYQALLMRDLARGNRAPGYLIADGDELKHYDFETVGEERLETPAGTFDTVKLRRVNAGARAAVLWCAPRLAYLPVRVDYLEKDRSTTSVVLERYQEQAASPDP
jgi:hypothetical protein